jgi:hypothetical protein
MEYTITYFEGPLTAGYQRTIEDMNAMAQDGWRLHTVSKDERRHTARVGYTFFWERLSR